MNFEGRTGKAGGRRRHPHRAVYEFVAPIALALAGVVQGAPPPAYLESTCLPEYDVTPQGFTVECWIRVRSTPGFDPRIIRAAGPDTGPCGYAGASVWEFAFCHLSDCSPGSLWFGIQASGECHEVFAAGRVDDGGYHHIAATYDGIRLRVYVDGSLRGEKEVRGLVARVSGGKLVAGSATDYGSPFDGEIDELRIWRIARSPSELRLGMAAEIGKAPRDLVGYWPMNGSGEDRSEGKNPLVPHNYITFPQGRLGRAASVMNVDVLRGEALSAGEGKTRRCWAPAAEE